MFQLSSRLQTWAAAWGWSHHTMTSMADIQELSVNHLEYFICFKFEGSCDGAEGSLKKKNALKESFIWEMYSPAELLIWMDCRVQPWKSWKNCGVFQLCGNRAGPLCFKVRERAEMNKMFDKAWKTKVRSIMLLRCVPVQLCFFTLTCSFHPKPSGFPLPVFLSSPRSYFGHIQDIHLDI